MSNGYHLRGLQNGDFLTSWPRWARGFIGANTRGSAMGRILWRGKNARRGMPKGGTLRGRGCQGGHGVQRGIAKGRITMGEVERGNAQGEVKPRWQWEGVIGGYQREMPNGWILKKGNAERKPRWALGHEVV